MPKAKDMIRQRVSGRQYVARTASEVFMLVEKASKQPTADLLTQWMEIQEKNAWLLRSLLEE